MQKSHGLQRERCGASREIPKETDVDDHIGYDLQGLFGIKQTVYKAYLYPSTTDNGKRQGCRVTEKATTKEAKQQYLIVEVDNIFISIHIRQEGIEFCRILDGREYETIINILN